MRRLRTFLTAAALALAFQPAFSYNCLVARVQTHLNEHEVRVRRECWDRWQKPDTAVDGTNLAQGELKKCGGLTWWSNIHSWHSIDGCLEACHACVSDAIEHGADAVTCHVRGQTFPQLSRCMIGFNRRERSDMKLDICNEPESTGDDCHVNPFIPKGHYRDLAIPGKEEPKLFEVIDIGCTRSKKLCMNWSLNGQWIPQPFPTDRQLEDAPPGDKRDLKVLSLDGVPMDIIAAQEEVRRVYGAGAIMNSNGTVEGVIDTIPFALNKTHALDMPVREIAPAI